MAVRDDDPVDATLEGAPVLEDAPDSEVLFASTESPLAPSPPPAAPASKPAARFAPPPVTLPDMPALSQPSQTGSSKKKKKKSKSLTSAEGAPVKAPAPAPAPLATTPSAPRPSSSSTTTRSPAPTSAPPTAPSASYNAAATVVASFKDIAAAAGVKLDLTGDGAAVGDGIAFDASGEGGIIFDASAEGAPIADDHGFDDDSATRADVSRFEAPEPAPPPKRPMPAPADQTSLPPPPKRPLPAPADQTSLPPPPKRPLPAPADQTSLPPPTSLPGSPTFSAPRTNTRGESRGGAAGVGGPLDPPVSAPHSGALDPPVPRKETRGPVAGVGALDPPVSRRDAGRAAADGPTDPTRGRKRRPVAAGDGDVAPPAGDAGGAGGGALKGVLGVAIIGVAILVVVMMGRGGGSTSQTLGPRETRELSERARSVLLTRARSDVEDPVRGIVRTLLGEAGRAIVVREAAADAWILPDQTVVVTDGLLGRLGTDGQLAAICAHALAHHQLGHVMGLSDGLDGPAVIAALRAPGSFDEAAADRAAAAMLVKGGWKTSALVDAQAALPEDSAWSGRHARRAEQIAGAVGQTGGSRDDRDWYKQKVLDVLRPPEAPSTPTSATTAD